MDVVMLGDRYRNCRWTSSSVGARDHCQWRHSVIAGERLSQHPSCLKDLYRDEDLVVAVLLV